MSLLCYFFLSLSSGKETNVVTSTSADSHTEGSPGPNSKDFVEHLRTIHFTLLLVCLALIVIGLSSGSYVIRKANDQLTQIMEAKDVWDNSWLSQSADEAAKRNCPHEVV